MRATVERPVVFRDFRLPDFPSTRWNTFAATKQLRVLSSITVRVALGRRATVNGRRAPRGTIARSFERIYRHTILNYERAAARAEPHDQTGRDVLLIISPDLFITRFRS